MLELLRGNANVRVFDRAPRAGFSAMARQMANPVRYLIWCMRNKNAILYVGLSGGLGQLVDWPFVLIGRIFHQRAYIHSQQFVL